MKKKLLFFLLLLLGINVSAQTIEKVYHFDNPKVKEVMGYHQIYFNECMQLGEIGNPSLPYYSVRLLLPQGSEASSVDIYFSDYVEMEGEYNLFPVQQAVPYSRPDMYKFSKNKDIYSSKSVYPSESHTEVTTQYLNGYAFAFLNFTPLQYVPSTGKVMYAKNVKVVVNTISEREDHSSMLWNTSDNIKTVSKIAQNPEMMTSYASREFVMTGYDMLVITGEEYIEGYSEYVNYYDSIGVRTRIVGLEEIYSEMEGQDNQEKIRNYIIREYQNEGIYMVTLGGDVNIVPYRGFYCIVNGDTEDYGIPADMYYSCLDGTWNDNGNNKWGEPEESDMMPEIGISRMSFANADKQAVLIRKTLSYQRNPVLGEFHDVTLGSEIMDDTPTYGGDYLELIIGERSDNGYTTIGIPEDYNFTRVYEEHGNWSGQNLMVALNEGAQYLHHAGHANSDFVAGWYNSDITDANFHALNGVDHNFTFMHSHGCICGSFDVDCIMERMTTINNFCVATAGNSRYGWYVPGGTEAPAAHLHREMIDAQYGNRVDVMAMALRESKVETASWTMYADALRWNTYCLNILGDGAVSIWLDEPFTPIVECDSEIMLGSESFEITIKNMDDELLSNFRCGLYYEDEIFGYAVSDELGKASLVFEEPISNVGTAQLKIAGPNAYPQIIDIQLLSQDVPYVVYDSYSLNDPDNQIDYLESHTINTTLKNVGSVDAANVVATLSCDKPEYVEITTSTIEIGDVAANSEVTLNECFAFTVCDSVPNKTNIKFIVTCTDGTDTWESRFNTIIYAPQFDFLGATVDDSAGNGNNQIEPGETISINFSAANTGNSNAENVTFAVFCSAPEISFTENEYTFEEVNAADSVEYVFTFNVDEAVELGVAYEFIVATYSGYYIDYDSYIIVIGSTEETFETADFSAYEWQFNESPWFIDDINSYQGNYCARSAQIYDNATSSLYIEIEIFDEMEISFFKKVSSESGWDMLFFDVDDVTFGEWSGESDWSQEKFTLPAGKHVLRWSYNKDSSMSSGQDCAWIDNIVFPPTTIIADVYTVTEKNIGMYPNPTEGVVTMQLGENQSDVILYNAMGQVLKEYRSVSGSFNIDLSEYNSGMYFLNIKNDTFNATKKIVKK
ncbi:MAG: T9SS type A sorting domain-containing protein [Lentimicrobiaceae bacterium]|nr:T9SS type A sorting domain-containing protein [Lentimicrobiaceae bacterium]